MIDLLISAGNLSSLYSNCFLKRNNVTKAFQPFKQICMLKYDAKYNANCF